ncbi:hypothetical protein FAGAP_12612 [Fusarium agapanthi]|uniref:Uncharacterized protein n=1 Tax=Fusarium agapanthi TaxID=1803897 RepID=A0A9P5AX65_9HYPO|nr:hypothetical protein FAGAP_12612 [Fusarium agapanthi]
MDAGKVKFNGKMYLGRKQKNKKLGHATRDEIARLTVEQAPDGAASAWVENGWHTSDPNREGSDQKEHCTVDFKDEKGNVIERGHVYKIVEPPHSEPDT